MCQYYSCGDEINPVVKKAFLLACDADGKGGEAARYCEFREFRLLLSYLKTGFEYMTVFQQIDANGTNVLSFEEFSHGIDDFNRLGCTITSVRETFDSIDKSHGGKISFNEFYNWAVAEEKRQEDAAAVAAAKAKVSYAAFASKLPTGKLPSNEADRKAWFASLDADGGGHLSKEEVTAGMLARMKSDASDKLLFHTLEKAFKLACDADGKGGESANSCDLGEFPVLLKFVKRGLEFLDVFVAVDDNGTSKLSLAEFTIGVPSFRELGVKIDNPEFVFKEIDASNGGVVDFDEFFAWALDHE
jgi:Ca2+-binding EF-hand superfamily protein